MMADQETNNGLSLLDDARLPQTYQTAKRALAECHRLDEVKTWSDKAVALAAYAKQAQDEDLELFSRRIRNRAVRRMGEMMTQVEPALNQHGNSAKGGASPSSRKEAASQAGISEDQRKQAQHVAALGEDEFDALNERARPASVTEMAEIGRSGKSQRKSSEKSACQAFIKDLTKVQLRLVQWREVVPLMTTEERKQAAQASAHLKKILGEVEW